MPYRYRFVFLVMFDIEFVSLFPVNLGNIYFNYTNFMHFLNYTYYLYYFFPKFTDTCSDTKMKKFTSLREIINFPSER